VRKEHNESALLEEEQAPRSRPRWTVCCAACATASGRHPVTQESYTKEQDHGPCEQQVAHWQGPGSALARTYRTPYVPLGFDYIRDPLRKALDLDPAWRTRRPMSWPMSTSPFRRRV